MEDTTALRDGRVDLEIGAIDARHPETQVEALATGHLVGIVRSGHPITGAEHITPERFAAAEHLNVSRRGRLHGPIDDRLAEIGLRRKVVATVPSYAAALLMVRETDLACLAPTSMTTLRTWGSRVSRSPWIFRR